MKKMFIGAFNEPNMDFKYFKELAEAGVNVLFINRSKSGKTHEDILQILRWGEELNIKVIVMKEMNDKVCYNDDYMKYSSFMGVDIQDEPRGWEVKDLEDEIPAFEKKYPGKLFYMNLFCDPTDSFEKRLGTESYEAYVDLFAERVVGKLSGKKILSVDIYPLMEHFEIGKEDKYAHCPHGYFMEERYAHVLENISHVAKQKGQFPVVYLQSVGYKSYINKHQPDEKDMRFQVYCALAYGYKGIIWFTAWTPTLKNSVLDIAFSSTNKYSSVTGTLFNGHSVNLVTNPGTGKVYANNKNVADGVLGAQLFENEVFSNAEAHLNGVYATGAAYLATNPTFNSADGWSSCWSIQGGEVYFGETKTIANA